MRILFLDVASGSGLLACVTEERVVAHHTIDHRIGDHELVPLMEEVLKEAGWSFSDLTYLACVIGPGGFTSLRVGVSAINALSWTLKIPVAGVHLSDLYATRVVSITSFLWLHSTKRTELFLRGFGDFAREWPDPTLITLDDFLQKTLQPATYCGELLPEHRAALAGAGGVELSLCPVMDILPQFLSSLTYTNHVLQPWYGRGW